jgi:hypothetical protein
MSNENKCPICKIEYDINNRKAFILLCGHSSCSQCIKFYKDAKKPIECGTCCKNTQSANIENISLYKNTQDSNTQQSIPNAKSSKDEFEIYIRKKDNKSKFSILVKKSIKIKDLKSRIYDQEHIEPETYDLSAGKPMIEYDKTLEFYGITSTRTLSMIASFKGGI